MSLKPAYVLLSIKTSAPQKLQGPSPSCSHTILPHDKQLLIRLCCSAWHEQGFPCLKTIEPFAASVREMTFTPFFFEPLLEASWDSAVSD
uniref:Uncharacterized protein n=1 Tax=Arundo donax TaxID=35708 RepID=A0A0A9E4E5_ARUDO